MAKTARKKLSNSSTWEDDIWVPNVYIFSWQLSTISPHDTINTRNAPQDILIQQRLGKQWG